MTQGLRTYFNPILNTVIQSLDAQPVFMRTKALKALGQIITSDPEILSAVSRNPYLWPSGAHNATWCRKMCVTQLMPICSIAPLLCETRLLSLSVNTSLSLRSWRTSITSRLQIEYRYVKIEKWHLHFLMNLAGHRVGCTKACSQAVQDSLQRNKRSHAAYRYV